MLGFGKTAESLFEKKLLCEVVILRANHKSDKNRYNNNSNNNNK